MIFIFLVSLSVRVPCAVFIIEKKIQVNIKTISTFSNCFPSRGNMYKKYTGSSVWI
jgi:hypothetical protein